MTRRAFVTYTGTTVLSALLPLTTSGETLGDFGIQLWTLREEMEKDPVATLKNVSAMGFRYVEGYGSPNGHFFGLSDSVWKDLLTNLNLTMYGTHLNTGRFQPELEVSFTKNYERLLDRAAFHGLKYVVCSWLKEEEYKTTEDCKRTAENMNQWGAIARRFGLSFAYHNHDFEFKPLADGQLPYDIFLKNTDENLVKFELDCYWIAIGKQSAVLYFDRFPGRFKLLHLKDMDKKDMYKNTELGTGKINFAEILKKRKQAGVEMCFLEQESYNYAPIESVLKGYKYLKNLNY